MARREVDEDNEAAPWKEQENWEGEQIRKASMKVRRAHLFAPAPWMHRCPACTRMDCMGCTGDSLETDVAGACTVDQRTLKPWAVLAGGREG